MASDPNGGVCLIRRVVIRNYKSIAACDVELGPLTFLVGPNGSGKSNFLDALRFVSDSLRYSLEHALRDRGGIDEIRRRSAGTAANIAIRVDFHLPDGGGSGHYALEIGGTRDSVEIQHEECRVAGGLLLAGHQPQFFEVSKGGVSQSFDHLGPARAKDRLYLVSVSGIGAFRFVYDALSNMGFYSLNPDVIRDLQPPAPGELLARDGANLPGVLQKLSIRNPRLKTRVEEYMAQVVPGIYGVNAIPLGPRETIEFLQQETPEGHRWRFLAANMSDGTLRALGVLMALFQNGKEDQSGPTLVGIEEPETALHPAAAGVLIDSMRDAISMRQVLVTSHSPELLDNPSIAGSEILAVVAEGGETRVGRLDEAGRSVLRDHLFTAGDLLRMNQLRPDPTIGALHPEDLQLFGTKAPA
ncbi:MAG TPA: AAA family ATPase [Longimicrobium sp.]|nr:AAA family ATPase [Longimicrobium sp.]